MTNSNEIDMALLTFESVVLRYEQVERALRIMGDHAIKFKALFHDAQDTVNEWQDKCIAKDAVIKRQREIIRQLEIRCGIDQEL